jgi:hypothetical protein
MMARTQLSIHILPAAGLLCALLAGCDQKPAEHASAESEKSAATHPDPDFPRGKATEYGLFKTLQSGWLADSDKTATGKILRSVTVEFVERTDRIPLRKGVVFGYRYWLKLSPEQSRPQLKRVLIHPPMTLPDGSTLSRSERMIRKKATHGIVTAIDVYALTEDYELVEGDWTFQIWYQDRKLAEQTFSAYTPDPEQTPGPSVEQQAGASGS